MQEGGVIMDVVNAEQAHIARRIRRSSSNGIRKSSSRYQGQMVAWLE